jgi:signal transduction histidine kinase/tetratricopeptide (TPR) repeat protein
MAQRSAKKRSAQSASFFWQAVFILLPVAVLAAIGVYTLKRDKAFAEQEARERAAALAEDASERLLVALAPAPSAQARNDLLQPGHPGTLFIDGKGNLISHTFLDPFATAQAPDVSLLSAAQAALWRKAEYMEFSHADYGQAARLNQEFLALNPPVDWVARAHYTLGILLLKQKNTNAALERFRLARDAGSPNLTQHLSQLRLFELAPSTDAVGNKDSSPYTQREEYLLWGAALRPTMASHDLLLAADRLGLKPPTAEFPSWSEVWKTAERQRALYRSLVQLEPALNLATGPTWRWTSENPPRFLQRQQGSSNDVYTLKCLDQEEVLAIAQKTLASVKGIPTYFGLSVSVAGRDSMPAKNLHPVIRTSNGKAGGLGWTETAALSPPETLGTARRQENGQPIVAVGVHLLSPEMLYEGVETRRYGFLALIAVSVAAALAGFFTARRAFLQQLKLSDLKTNFVSSVSHELRAPVASLRLMAERLESGRVQDPARQNEYFRFIVQECRRLGTMIENVLDFSRIERGRKEYDFEPTDLVALVENSIKLMEPYAAERKIKLEHKIEGTPMPVLADGLSLQQVMLNLLDNAVKHSPSGSQVEVGIAFPGQGNAATNQHHMHESYPPEKNPVRLWVADHGEGIPKEEHAKIFERFYRCGSELRRTTQGVGIGLSIVKHVVEAHGGRVIVESEPGAGSRFTVELPVSEPHPSA